MNTTALYAAPATTRLGSDANSAPPAPRSTSGIEPVYWSARRSPGYLGLALSAPLPNRSWWSLRIRGHGDFEDFPAIPPNQSSRASRSSTSGTTPTRPGRSRPSSTRSGGSRASTRSRWGSTRPTRCSRRAAEGRRGRRLRVRPRLLQGLRHLRGRVPVRRDRDGAGGDIASSRVCRDARATARAGLPGR
jgi:hypothetical protein